MAEEELAGDSTYVYDALPDGMLPQSVASTIQSIHPASTVPSAPAACSESAHESDDDDDDDLAPREPTDCFVQRVTAFSSQYGVNRYQ